MTRASVADGAQCTVITSRKEQSEAGPDEGAFDQQPHALMRAEYSGETETRSTALGQGSQDWESQRRDYRKEEQHNNTQISVGRLHV